MIETARSLTLLAISVCRLDDRYKGVVITTSSFTREAVDYAGGLQSAIILVDGRQLAELMIDYGIGVADIETIRLKRIDEDYFTEDTVS